MQHRRILTTTLALLFLSFASGASADRTLVPPIPTRMTDPAARRICVYLTKQLARLKQNPGKLALYDQIYTPFPQQPRPTTEVMLVPWHGVHLVVPARAYTVAISYNPTRSSFSLVLVLPNRGGGISVGPMIGDTPLRDVFRIAGDKRPPLTEREAVTKKIFGGFPNQFDIERIMFSVKASSITCTPATVYRALRNVFVMALKGIGSPAPRTAHRDVGLSPSSLVVHRSNSSSRVRSQYRISYRHNGAYHTVGGLYKDPGEFARHLALLPLFSVRKPSGLKLRPLDPNQLAIINFVNRPTSSGAKKLLSSAKLTRTSVQAIKLYLKTSP